MTKHIAKMLTTRQFVWLLGFAQFVNIVEFMMTMPLGPDLAQALNFAVTDIGLISGAYSFTSAIVGFAAALILDYIPRRRALLFCIGGMMVTTALAALAWDLTSMVVFRALSGLFGGPIWGLCAAILVDNVAPNQRGRAIGALMGSFSIATVVGIPLSLETAELLGWRAPFILVSALCIISYISIWHWLPEVKALAEHQPFTTRLRSLGRMLNQKIILHSYACSVIAMFAGFLIIPPMAAYVQMNFGYPRADLSLLYLVGGAATYFMQRFSGWMVDNSTATAASLLFGIGFVANLFQGFVFELHAVPVVVTYTLFMVCMSGRGVASQALGSRVPAPSQRGAYMAIQGSLINIATASASYISSCVLREENGRLVNMDILALSAIMLSLIVPYFFFYVEKRIKH